MAICILHILFNCIPLFLIMFPLRKFLNFTNIRQYIKAKKYTNIYCLFYLIEKKMFSIRFK